VAEAVVAAMDAREVKKKEEEPKEVLRLVDGEIHTPSDQQVLSLRNKYSRSTKDMLNPLSPVTIDPRIKHVMPEQPPLQPSKDPFLYDPLCSKEGLTSP